MRCCKRHWLIGGLYLGLLLSGAAETVSRKPPVVYQEKIAPHWTPLEMVLEDRGKAGDEDDEGVILLQEDFVYVEPDGRKIDAKRWVFEARSESGVDKMSKDTISYQRSYQKIHLVEARTLQPDGRRLEVDAKAAILQTPQSREADNLYSDEGQLTVIYPEVKVGSVVELIVVREDMKALVPDTFARRLTWGHGWYLCHMRRIVELPGALASKLRIRSRGETPEPEKEAPEDGRQRWEWSVKDQKPIPWEHGAPSSVVTGPCVGMSTWQDWDEMGKWYSGLLAKRDALPEDLAKSVDDWTEGMEDPGEIVRLLTSKVANDVRYTGLEFGLAGYQPYPCGDVWKNRFGDCKDKANLLKGMLKHRGIESHITLIETSHAGKLWPELPSLSQFNHAILAVKQTEGADYQYIDPTIRGALPGVLGPGDVNREVLVVHDDGKTELLRTPKQNVGTEVVRFELNMEADGALGGWMKIEAEDYYACSWHGYLLDFDPDDRRRAAERHVRKYYENARVADTKEPVFTQEEGHAKLVFEIYFVDPAASGRRERLPWPSLGHLVPDLEENTSRRTSMYLWEDVNAVHLDVRLPEGLTAGDLPQQMSLMTDNWSMTGVWEGMKEARLRASVRVEQHDSLIEANEYTGLRQAALATRHWLGTSLPLVAKVQGEDQGQAKQSPPVKPLALDFPMMPSGQGQLALVDSRYPEGGNQQQRRRALEMTLQYFPEDKSTVLDTTTRLASIDWNESAYEDGIRRLKEVLPRVEREVSAEDFAWSRYVLALCIEGNNQKGEALAIYESLSKQEDLTDYRRSWSYYQAGQLLVEEEAARGLKLIEEAMTLEEPTSQAELGELFVRLWLKTRGAAGLAERLGTLFTAGDEDEHTGLVQSLIARSESSEYAHAEALYEVLNALELPDGAAAEAALKEGLAGVEDAREEAKLRDLLRKEIREAFNDSPPEGWEAIRVPDDLKSAQDFIAATGDAESAGDKPLALRLAVEPLLRFDELEDFGWHLWQAAVYANWDEHEWTERLLRWGKRLPDDSDSWHEVMFLSAIRSGSQGDEAAAVESLKALVEHPRLAEDYRVTAWQRYGLALEQSGRIDDALAMYRKLEPDIDSLQAITGLIRAAMLQVMRGKPEEAQRILSLLTDVGDDFFKQSEMAEDGFPMMVAVREKRFKDWCQRVERWKPRWLELCQEHGIKMDQHQVRIIDDFDAFTKRFDQAQAQKQREVVQSGMMDLARLAETTPAYAIEFARRLLFSLPAVAPELVQDARDTVAALLKDFPDTDRDLKRSALLFSSVANVDRGKAMIGWLDAQEGMNLSREMGRSRDVVGRALGRLYGVASLQTEQGLELASEELKAHLEGDLATDRLVTVNLLTEILSKLERKDEALEVLANAKAHEDFEGDEVTLKGFNQRMLALKAGGGSSDDFAAALADWLERHGFVWLDFVEPKDLNDPRLKDITAVMDNLGEGFMRPEFIKTCLLVARDETKGDELRYHALTLALVTYRELQMDLSEWRQAVPCQALPWKYWHVRPWDCHFTPWGLSGSVVGFFVRFS